MIIPSTNSRANTTVKMAASNNMLRARPALPGAAPRTGDVQIGRRLRDWKTLLGFGISAAIILLFILTTHLDLGSNWANVQAADLRYLGLALGVYLGAFVFRGLRWRLLLRHADLGQDLKLPPLAGLVEIYYLTWFVNCLVPAKLGDAYRAYLLNKHSGANLERTLGTVVGERMADVLALGVLLLASGLLIVGQLAGEASNLQFILTVSLVLIVAIGAGVMLLRLASTRLLRVVPARWRDRAARFLEGTLRTFRRDVQLPLYALTCLIWAGEVLRIWLVMQALHVTGLTVGVIVFTALAGSLLSTIPFTPGGLGAVEGASVAILGAFGVAAALAGAVAIVDRAINYWSNIPLGALVYAFSKSK